MQTNLDAKIEVLPSSKRDCRILCRVEAAAKDWLPPAPRVAKHGSMGAKKDRLPKHPPGPEDQHAISHKCDIAGCITKGHLEFYNFTRENAFRA